MCGKCAVGNDLHAAAAAENDLDQVIDRVVDDIRGSWVIAGLERPVDQQARRVLEPVLDEQQCPGRGWAPRQTAVGPETLRWVLTARSSEARASSRRSART